MLLPKPLTKNSTIGLICPGGGFDDYKPIKRVIKYLKQKGYKVKVGRSLVCPKKDYKYLSGSDTLRLKDFHSFCSDKNIDAIFCLRGGYGSLRLLNLIDYDLVKKSKKIIVGFSDISTLLCAIYAKTKLITIHGPLLGIDFLQSDLKPADKQAEKYLWDILSGKKLDFKYSKNQNSKLIYPGQTKGILLGGNLSCICSLLGSKYLPDFSNSILILEECNEEPYKIDRMLTQLDNAAVFKKVKGIIFGSFYKCKFKSQSQIIQLLKSKISKYKIPSVYGFPLGHGKRNYPVPFGIPAYFDAEAAILKSI